MFPFDDVIMWIQILSLNFRPFQSYHNDDANQNGFEWLS